MKFSLPMVAFSALLLAAPADAIVGGAKPSDQGVGRSVVTIVGSGGTFCSGSLIATDLVLTAGHCVQPGSVYKILEYGPDKQPLLRDTRNVAFHPGFDMKAINAHRASADVALLQLEAALSDRKPAAFGTPKTPLVAGNPFTVAGVGVTIRGDGRSGGTIRVADLVATGQPGSLQIRLMDPTGQGIKPGLGACTGDSGAPVFEDQQGVATIVGVVSWSTGPNNSAGCGGLTGVTPLTLYRDWIVQTARQWSSALAR
jgi:secreted trypsin-like serine protease